MLLLMMLVMMLAIRARIKRGNLMILISFFCVFDLCVVCVCYITQKKHLLVLLYVENVDIPIVSPITVPVYETDLAMCLLVLCGCIWFVISHCYFVIASILLSTLSCSMSL